MYDAREGHKVTGKPREGKPPMTLEEAKEAIKKACGNRRSFTSIGTLCSFVNGGHSGKKAKKQLTPQIAMNAVRSMRSLGILIDSTTIIKLVPQ